MHIYIVLYIVIYTHIYIIGKNPSLDSTAHLIHPKLIFEYVNLNKINNNVQATIS